MKITESVYMLDCTPESHAYLILEPEVMLVDSGLPGKRKKIQAEMRAIGVDPLRIKHILLTHYDADHIGNAAAMQEETGAAVWASADEIPYITGVKPRPGIKRLISQLMHVPVPAQLHAYPPEGRLGAVTVLPAPGHSPGHVCLLYREVLFAGDLVLNAGGKIKPSPAIMTWNMPLVHESMRRIAAYPFTWVCPAHGLPLARGGQWQSVPA